MNLPQERVIGLAGVLVRAEDPNALAQWYHDHLGLDIESWCGAKLPLKTDDDKDGAYNLWAAFPADTEYFGDREKSFMVGFRVRDLDAMLQQLRDGGCNVIDKREESKYGRFGWVTDPEGNRIELWEAPDEMVDD